MEDALKEIDAIIAEMRESVAAQGDGWKDACDWAARLASATDNLRADLRAAHVASSESR